MRLSAILACAVAFALPGCVSGFEDGFGSDLDCSSDVQQDVSRDPATLYPAVVAGGPSPASNPAIAIHARPGQTVVAQATWQVAAGEVRVAYDGPEGNVTAGTDGTWQLVAYAAAGNVTLGLEGDPLASGVTYTLQLSATGCT